ncbi:hypothetical protein NXT3_PB00224 (plasmid) [Sinorhizobium fredii]|uniref:Uncharacterized protein n=1 Tax=Rhizobium fredii TaxID=380 RepID=A0A2L0HBL9_RHIFR|nr:hypothetical protein NXT3_PB00224 [Sinorhizobium fredii]
MQNRAFRRRNPAFIADSDGNSTMIELNRIALSPSRYADLSGVGGRQGEWRVAAAPSAV